MIVPERVAAFLVQNKGQPFCDDCLKDSLDLKRRQQAQQATSALGASGKFRRGETRCARCHAV